MERKTGFDPRRGSGRRRQRSVTSVERRDKAAEEKNPGRWCGAEDGVRTRDLLLGKEAFYH
jgi:hypothetical protein